MSDKPEGYMPRLRGEAVERTKFPCPKCYREGLLTIGRETPTVVKYDGDFYCLGTHGKVIFGSRLSCDGLREPGPLPLK